MIRSSTNGSKNDTSEFDIIKSVFGNSIRNDFLKILIKDIQYEITSAWKFFAATGHNKNALVILHGFTTMPLSLARNCRHVYILGLEGTALQLFQTLAGARQISNYTLLDQIPPDESSFDTVVLADPRWLSEQKLTSLKVHLKPRTELWLLPVKVGAKKRVMHPRDFIKNLQKPKPPRNFSFQFGDKAPIPMSKLQQVETILGWNVVQVLQNEPSMIAVKRFQILKQIEDFSLNKSEQPGPEKEFIVKLVERGRPSQVFITQLLQALPDYGIASGRLKGSFVSPSGKLICFIGLPGRRNAVIRLPFTEEATAKLKMNHQILQSMTSQPGLNRKYGSRFPRPLGRGVFQGQHFFVEEQKPGISGMKLKARTDKTIEDIFAVWFDMQSVLVEAVELDEDRFNAIIAEPVRAAFSYFDREMKKTERLDRLQKFMRDRLMGKTLWLSTIHGDFSLKNMLFNRKRSTFASIIDWDMCRQSAMPVLDLLHFYVRFIQQEQKGAPLEILYALIFEKSIKNELFAKLLNNCQNRFNMQDEMLEVALVLYWAYRTEGHFQSLKFMDQAFCQRNFLEPLHVFEKLEQVS